MRKITNRLDKISCVRSFKKKFMQCLNTCARALRLHRLADCSKRCLNKCFDMKKYEKFIIEKDQ